MGVKQIKGTITLDDGSTSEFRVERAEFGGFYTQWGAESHRLGRTVNIVEGISDLLDE